MGYLTVTDPEHDPGPDYENRSICITAPISGLLAAFFQARMTGE